MNLIAQNTFRVILTYILFVLFLYTAVNKVTDYDNFLNELEKSPLIPRVFASAIAYMVIAVEFIISLGLLIEKTNRNSLAASGGLLLLFTVYIIMILLYSPYVPCSCGGIISALSWTQHLILNIGLTIACFYYIIVSSPIIIKQDAI
ncbi:MauE/DoxX family redox-associated membrane protein [Pedobacter rhodius]|uniref:DoxX family membrane protein n=1 Tax=Pedobacter rhodius TaxID=3004098 RepID=A0ABT4KVY5_9SPHI|nr:MauE/DoxX family redox-associated membrane protein [Pedobacter sp. SJ11]MCZ4222916.1 DoxX family membrane protein [Pedobacter sp. SJ11]